MTRQSRAWIALLAVASVASAAAVTLLPAAVGRTVDASLAAARGQAGGTPPWQWVAGCAALTVVIACGGAVSRLAIGTVTGNCAGWLRHHVLGHVLACGPKLTRGFAPGDAVSRLIGGTVDAGGAPCGAVLALTAAIPAFGSIVALGLIDPWLALAFAAGLPAVALVLRSFARNTSEVVLRYQQEQGAIAARLTETMTGARTIAAAGTCEQEIGRVLSPLPRLRACGHQTWRLQGRIAAQGNILIPVLQILVLAVGGIELTAHRISPGELLAASQYAALGAGIGAAISQINRLARGRSGAARVTALLSVCAPGQGSMRLPAGRGQLEFRGAAVRCGNATVIENLDMVIPGGTSVAVVGRTGAGKSTVAALAGRLIDPSAGEVLLDGVPLTRLARPELRAAVSYAFERPALLGATVRDAIGFGMPRLPDEAVAAAAHAARADQFIGRLPRRYQTALAQAPLSGGEIQRLGLARALAHAGQARVLVLDDATSSLDTVTEMEVSRALTRQHGDSTKIIVTHRAATAARAGLVAWLDSGRLQALAPHRELWQDPRYRAVFGSGENTGPEGGSG
jgi:ATP-binding cassette subfamily B protein